MIRRTKSKIIVDGKQRKVNIEELRALSRKYLSPGMSAESKDQFVDEVIFRISDGEYESEDLEKMSVEAYYFAACFAYTKEYGYAQLLDELDDGRIFDFCGVKLPE